MFSRADPGGFRDQPCQGQAQLAQLQVEKLERAQQAEVRPWLGGPGLEGLMFQV